MTIETRAATKLPEEHKLSFLKLLLLNMRKYAANTAVISLGVISSALAIYTLPKALAYISTLKATSVVLGGFKTAWAFTTAHTPVFLANAISWLSAKIVTAVTLGGHLTSALSTVANCIAHCVNLIVDFGFMLQGQILVGLTSLTANAGPIATMLTGAVVAFGELFTLLYFPAALVDTLSLKLANVAPVAALGRTVQQAMCFLFSFVAPVKKKVHASTGTDPEQLPSDVLPAAAKADKADKDALPEANTTQGVLPEVDPASSPRAAA